jgi:cysteine desulfurase family protein (TIGR01976 family)
MSLDLKFVRSQFPALNSEWVFFENAGGSQTLAAVVMRIQDYLLHSNVQLGASYELSARSDERVAEAAQGMATYVNAPHAADVVMGSSTTMLMRILSICLRKTWQPGDEVIVTNCDHEANIGAWADLAETGITVKTWSINPETLTMEVRDLEQLLTPRTRLVAVTHTSNVLGTIHPIREFARVVHECGAMICVDGVAYAPHRRIDVQDLDVDFYAFSFYKTYGPHYALLYGKRDHLLRIPGLNHFFIGQDQVPYKFQPGSVNYELSYGMLGLWDYLEGFAQAHGGDGLAGDRPGQVRFAFDTIAEHEEKLAERLLAYLNGKPNVRIIGRTDADRTRRVPTVSFVVEGRPSDAITRTVDQHKIAIRHGDFYARRLIDALGLGPQNGVVRVSMVHYNTTDEIDRLIQVFEQVL